jgi:hypothetical protein
MLGPDTAAAFNVHSHLIANVCQVSGVWSDPRRREAQLR